MGFLVFFTNQPGGQTPQPIFTKNGLIDVDSGRAFCSKNQNFFKPLTPRTLKPGNFGKFLDLENFGQKSPIIKFPSGNDP